MSRAACSLVVRRRENETNALSNLFLSMYLEEMVSYVPRSHDTGSFFGMGDSMMTYHRGDSGQK